MRSYLTREVSYGALVLLLWDMCLTFADEVGTPRSHFVFHLVARNQRALLPYRSIQYGLQGGALQVLFLVNRYVAPAMIFLGIWSALLGIKFVGERTLLTVLLRHDRTRYEPLRQCQ
jgi:hypothetical protein